MSLTSSLVVAPSKGLKCHIQHRRAYPFSTLFVRRPTVAQRDAVWARDRYAIRIQRDRRRPHQRLPPRTEEEAEGSGAARRENQNQKRDQREEAPAKRAAGDAEHCGETEERKGPPQSAPRGKGRRRPKDQRDGGQSR